MSLFLSVSVVPSFSSYSYMFKMPRLGPKYVFRVPILIHRGGRYPTYFAGGDLLIDNQTF